MGCELVADLSELVFNSLEVRASVFRSLLVKLAAGEIQVASKEGSLLGGFLRSMASPSTVGSLISDEKSLYGLIDWISDSVSMSLEEVPDIPGVEK